jgi:hypothetical protein
MGAMITRLVWFVGSFLLPSASHLIAQTRRTTNEFRGFIPFSSSIWKRRMKISQIGKTPGNITS